jgi:2-methylcitrate dehydratase PrpD
MTARVAAYIEADRDRRIPNAAWQAAFKCILDLLGCAVAGVSESLSTGTRQVALATMRPGAVPIWFSGEASSVAGAAWANSAAASALDLDDGHRLARGHPGAAVIPTAFAVAHECRPTVEQLIRSIIVGYEVGVTIGAARSTYGNTGTWSTYAVVATAAALRRTPADTVAHALAIAGESAPNQAFSSASGPTPAPEGSDVKEGIPWSVLTGLMALDLAEQGFTGPRNVLDSPAHYRFSESIPLGSAQHICNTYFKFYACCRHVHAPLKALLQLRDRHVLGAEAIDAIEVETYAGALRIPNTLNPRNLVEVQYSIPYCMALAVILGPQALLPLTEAALHRADVRALAERVSLTLNPTFDARFPAETLARVTIRSGDHHFASDVTGPDGEATDAPTWEMLETKFKAATRLVATSDQQNTILKAVHSANAGDLSALMATLATGMETRACS